MKPINYATLSHQIFSVSFKSLAALFQVPNNQLFIIQLLRYFTDVGYFNFNDLFNEHNINTIMYYYTMLQRKEE